jgi:predicted ester cyclase
MLCERTLRVDREKENKMGNREIAKKFLAEIGKPDYDAAGAYCADNFTYSGPVPKPISLQEWRGMAASIWKAFPDWDFDPQVEREECNVVHVTSQVTATHTGDLDLTSQGLGVIPTTGKSISLPKATGRVTFEGDKVVNLHFDVAPGGGMPGLLAQLGVKES